LAAVLGVDVVHGGFHAAGDVEECGRGVRVWWRDGQGKSCCGETADGGGDAWG